VRDLLTDLWGELLPCGPVGKQRPLVGERYSMGQLAMNPIGGLRLKVKRTTATATEMALGDSKEVLCIKSAEYQANY